jgi:hypothetical protein
MTDSLLTFLAGKLSVFDRSGAFVDSIALPGESIIGVTQLPPPYAFVLTGSKGTILLTARGTRGPKIGDVSRNLSLEPAGPAAVAPMSAAGSTGYGIAVTSTDGRLYLLDDRLNTVAGFPVSLREGTAFPPVLADIDGDGARDIIAASDRLLHVFNRIGVELDGFPLQLPSSTGSAPIIADFNGDGIPDIVVVSREGLVTGVDRHGKTISGFPLSAGRGVQWPAAFLTGDSICLAVASSEDGSLSAWRTGRLTGSVSVNSFPWPQYQHDPARSGYDAAVLPAVAGRTEFFPASRAYNWPNPAYGGITYLRYYVREDAGVTITIFDFAGDLVGKYSQNGVGGVDNEFALDVSGIQSGIYFARIEARSSQETGTALVKIAVVK